MSTLWALLHHYVGLVQRAGLEVNTPLFSARGFDQALSSDRACRELVINLIAWCEQAVMSIVPIDSRKKTAIKY